MSKIRVLVVDDSAFMRVALKKIIESEKIEVCGIARDGKDALDKIDMYKPDIITLDIEMPVMNGIDCLREIKKKNLKIPVIMVSSLTSKGAAVTLECLELGAVDFITKPNNMSEENYGALRTEIQSMILGAANVDVSKFDIIKNKLELMRQQRNASGIGTQQQTIQQTQTPVSYNKISSYEICLIGTSTGGPPALQKVISELPGDFPLGVVIVQHMPLLFTASLAERLNSLSKLKVKESEDGDIIKPGLVILGKAGIQLNFVKNGSNVVIRHSEPLKDDLFKPSVNHMFKSASKIYRKILAVVMTGMGNDGLEAVTEMKKNINVHVIAESEKTAVVFGMPGVLVKAGLADTVAPLWDISSEILKKI